MRQFLESSNLLETVATETGKVSEDAKQLVAGLSEAQLNWKPAADRWSIAQCLVHLAIATEKFGPYVTAAIARGREKWPVTNAVPYRPTRIGGWLVKQLLPETTRKVSARKIFRPTESDTIHDAPVRFLKAQDGFLRFVREAKGIDYNKSKLRSPV